jgi:ABC-2 type transport system permease protein
MSPLWLIAEREFRTYVATLSFWAALAIGPIAAGIGLMLMAGTQQPPAPLAVEILSPDVQWKRAVQVALDEAAALEGHHFSYGVSKARMTVAGYGPGLVDIGFTSQFPLTETGRVLVARTLERDAARRTSATTPLTVRQTSLPDQPAPADAGAIARFILMMMLWLTLTGSLGMLLQTVVRERATRSLEILLASASPHQIMVGKLVGVGGVSLLVLAAWLGPLAVFAAFAPKGGLLSAILIALAAPDRLVHAVVVYLLAYAFYGSVTVALGAMARDSASAQNLSRPMFIVLLLAFFAGLAAAMGNAVSLHWLLYIPLFTPFMMLVLQGGAIPPIVEISMLGMLALTACVAARFAIGRFVLRDSGAALVPGAG